MMLFTEDEAKTKQCRLAPPAGVMAGLATAGGQRTGTVLMQGCAASECMLWRFGEPEYETRDDQPVPSGEWKRVTEFPSGGVESVVRWRRVLRKRGYCGLAGRP